MRMLAFSIYGLLLLSGPLDGVSHIVVEIFQAVEKQNINPIPAIVAEIFLTYYREKGEGSLKCCN